MTAPFYSDDWCTLYLGDCLTVTEWLTADVLVTDPVYGMGLTSGRRGDFGDLSLAGDEDVTVRDAALALWGDRPALAFSRDSLPCPNWKMRLVWEKGDHTGMGDLRIPWRPSIERIDVLGSWPDRPNRGRGGGGRVSPVIRCMAPAPARRNGRQHPTEKPVALMSSLIGQCPPGVIADPFAGSGSTLVAAKQLGRRAIGVELEERYCEVIARRLSQGVLDFGGEAS